MSIIARIRLYFDWCHPFNACRTHGRCWTHSEWAEPYNQHNCPKTTDTPSRR